MSLPLKPSRRDPLATTAGEREIELTEQELTRVCGGRKAGERPIEYLVIKMSDILITGV
jgi:hypothetical protein